jgi:YwiC-like protein
MLLTVKKFRWRERIKLALPKEHGSWFLALEPVALGLLVAPTAAGAALAVAAVSGFLLRRPLKIFSREKDCERWKSACASVFILTIIALLGLSVAAKIGGLEKLWPLLPSALAGLVFVWCDSRNEAREGAVEVAGTVAFGLLPATFGTLADWSGAASLALAAIMLVRSVPTILTVRTNLRIRKGQAVSILAALLTMGAGLALSVWLVSLRLAPWVAALFAAVFAARTVWLLCWRPRLAARTIGIIEATLGGLMVLTLASTWKHF